VAVGDFEDAASIGAALRGVDRVFLVSADGPRKVAHETAVIDAAGHVGLIVKASTVGAEPGSPLPCFDWQGRIERYLRGAGVPFVILASGFYMTNLLAAAEPVCTQGILPAPAGTGRVAAIDPRDVGRVAATVLATPGHAGRCYGLTGPAAIGYAEMAAVLGARYVDVPPAAAREALAAAGTPGWLVDHLDGAFALVRSGALADTTDTVRVLTGREPTAFAAWAREHADVFAPTVGRRA
jgi:uncharacterized protein YbjT (DUF2867 family)